MSRNQRYRMTVEDFYKFNDEAAKYDITEELVNKKSRDWYYKYCKIQDTGHLDQLDSRTPLITFTKQSYDAMWDAERRPVYTIIGKPVSKELAFEIIRKTDNYGSALNYPYPSAGERCLQQFFAQHGVMLPIELPECFYSIATNNWFGVHTGRSFKEGFDVPFGWCHPDGYIGNTYYSSVKNPFPDEIIDEWDFIIQNVTDQLDLVMVFYDASERFKEGIKRNKQIAFGLHIKGNTINVLCKMHTIDMFREYMKKYGNTELVEPVWTPQRIREALPYNKKVQEEGFFKYICNLENNTDQDGIMSKNIISAVDGKVDKNNQLYYGIASAELDNGPLGMKDLEEMARRWREDQKQTPSPNMLRRWGVHIC